MNRNSATTVGVQKAARRMGDDLSTSWKSFQYTPLTNLLRIILLSQFTVKPVFARTGTVEFPHDKSVFLYEIKNGPVLVRNSLEPLVLVNVAFDNVQLSIQDIMKMFAFIEHRQTVRRFNKSIAFLGLYGNRRGEVE